MNLSEAEKLEITKQLSADIPELLDGMTNYVSSNTKSSIRKAAIWYVALLRNIDYDKMESYLGNSREDSIYGGEYATEYLKLLRQEIESLIISEIELLKFAICEKYRYCEKRKSGVFQNEDYSLAFGVADALMTHLTSFPLPIASVSAYLVKKGLLDGWCKCD